jgi:hypothetical protein
MLFKATHMGRSSEAYRVVRSLAYFTTRQVLVVKFAISPVIVHHTKNIGFLLSKSEIGCKDREDFSGGSFYSDDDISRLCTTCGLSRFELGNNAMSGRGRAH